MATEKCAAKRLDYLHRVSDHLLVKVPSLSSYLRVEESKLVTNKDGNTSGADQNMCRSCGNLLIPGWSCRSRNPRGRRCLKYSNNGSGVRLLQCDKCGTTSKIKQHRKYQQKNTTTQARNTIHPPETVLDATQNPKTHTTTSSGPPEGSDTPEMSQNLKQPAALSSSRRARNKKTSLQAMLAKSKADVPAGGGGGKGLGLDLGDFLKD